MDYGKVDTYHSAHQQLRSASEANVSHAHMLASPGDSSCSAAGKTTAGPIARIASAQQMVSPRWPAISCRSAWGSVAEVAKIFGQDYRQPKLLASFANLR